MAEFFYLALEKSNPVEVECLKSYMRRLALLHCMTYHQLIALMDERRKRDESDGERFLKRLAHERGTVLCGYSPDTERFVRIVETYTGCQGLRAATFLALQPSVSTRASRVMKPYRAWCPACFTEALRNDEVVYDRLYWMSAYCSRCVIHKIRLEERCPHCGTLQRRYGKKGTITTCCLCSRSLISRSSAWQSETNPSYGEREITELIGYIAQHPDHSFSLNVLGRFYHEMYMSQPARVVPRNRYTNAVKLWCTPLLSVVVSTAVTYNISLVLLLDDPTLAAHAASESLVASAPIPSSSRERRPPSVYSKLRELLDSAMDAAIDHETPPSLKAICDEAGVSTGYARHHFNRRCLILGGRRAVAIWRNREAAVGAVKHVLEHGLYEEYLKGLIHSHDEIEKQLVEQTGVSRRIARIGLALYIEELSPPPISTRT